MVKLGYRSSKLGYKSNKLVVSSQFQLCVVDASYYISGYSAAAADYGYCATNWPYPTATFSTALTNLASGSWSPAACTASVITDHSHGCSVVSHTHKGQFNSAFVTQGERVFLKPSGVTTVTESYLRIYNAGRVLHTVMAGTDGDEHVVILNAYKGLVPLNYAGGTLDEGDVFLSLYFYTNSTTYHRIDLSLATLRTYNGSNGVIAADLGRYTYLMNGYIDIPMPTAVNTILSQYTGIVLSMFWSWSSAYHCGYCIKCLGDYYDTGYGSRLSTSSVICTSTHYAHSPFLYVR